MRYLLSEIQSAMDSDGQKLDRLSEKGLTYLQEAERSRWMLMRLLVFVRSPLRSNGHLHYPSGFQQSISGHRDFHGYILNLAGHFLNGKSIEISENGIGSMVPVLTPQIWLGAGP